MNRINTSVLSFRLKPSQLVPGATVVGIDFRMFLRVARDSSLSVVPTNYGEGNQRQSGFSVSLRYRWLELKNTPKYNLELGLAHGELRGGNSGKGWSGRGAAELGPAWATSRELGGC